MSNLMMENYNGFEIAIIGIAGKFPKADDIGEFWENLKNARDCVSDFSQEEALFEGESSLAVEDPSYVRSHAYIEGKEYFDPEFFGYRPDEAELMDPQMRLFHEISWKALEDSGYSKLKYPKEVGVFATASPNLNWQLYAYVKNQEGLVDDYTASQLMDISFLSTRIAYKLNLRGPAMFLHSACSSSLAVIHHACNSLLLGECHMALAGGATITHRSKRGYFYQEGMINSQDGRCRPFDEKSTGTISGEGVGVVILKRLQDAIDDKDHIYAIIKGSGINNDGNNKVGYTAPSIHGQTEAIRRAHKMADVNPESISYVEAHGTATELGDPIEIQALNEAFNHSKTKSCAIGSVKSNIGHLDATAGIAGFIKTVLSLKNRQILPSIHFNNPNSKIEFDKGPFYVNTKLKKWKFSGGPLRAGVSSFGIGGTNVHVVLEEAPERKSKAKSRDFKLLTFSAKTALALERIESKTLPNCNV